MNKQYNFVDLFAGCGGLSLGLQQAGFTPWFVNEIVEQFCNTYKYNHELSEEHYFVGDIAELNLHLDEYKEILSDITLVCGGPPCQGFSMANRQRILDDPRNALYSSYLCHHLAHDGSGPLYHQQTVGTSKHHNHASICRDSEQKEG